MKKIILCLFMILVLAGCDKETSKNSDKIINIDINDKEKKDVIDGVTIELDNFNYKDGYSTVNLLITNNNDYMVYIGSYKVLVYDKDNNLIGTFNPNFDSSLIAGAKTNQMFSVQEDYTKAYRIEYKFDDIQKIEDK